MASKKKKSTSNKKRTNANRKKNNNTKKTNKKQTPTKNSSNLKNNTNHSKKEKNSNSSTAKIFTLEEAKKQEKKSFFKKLSFRIFRKDKLNDSSHRKNNHQKENKKLFSKKVKKMLLVFSCLCIAIILLECIFLVVHYLEVEKKNIYYDMLNGIAVDNNNILAVGQSDFKYSTKNNYTNGIMRGKFIKYDIKGRILFEKMYDKGINSNFNSIISVSDGYVVVGSGVFNTEEEESREAIIIKYDKEGNVVWEKFYSVITNTSFNKVIEVEDGYVAIGQSIYANMEMGNHTTGGGIIVKYDKNGKELWHNNHGGTKSGNFNDIVEVNGELYVVGKDGVDSSNLVKYDEDGKYLWHKNYRYTDNIGFTGITYLDDGLYVVGSKKILPEGTTDSDDRNTDNTDCLLIKYDLDGEIIFEKTFGGSSNERYNSVLSYHNNLYVVGHTTSRDVGLKIVTDGKMLTGIIVHYDKNGNILKKDVYGGSNNETLTNITTDGISLYISGYSNSKDGSIKTNRDNGKDYFGKVIKSNLKFKTLMVK